MLQNIYHPLTDAWILEGISILTDNIIWIIHAPGGAWAVDPGDAAPLLEWNRQHPECPLQGIFITHKHHDHIGGLPALLEQLPSISVWAPAGYSWPFPHHGVNDREYFSPYSSQTALSFPVEVIHVPGHTLEHVAYYLPEQKILFCGDTLFSLGCGRMFEGTAEQFWQSLVRLRALPSDTWVACTHNYTLANARFALMVNPGSIKLKTYYEHVLYLQEQGKSPLPSMISLERDINPFLRCDDPAIRTSVATWAQQPLLTASDVFAALRNWKNHF